MKWTTKSIWFWLWIIIIIIAAIYYSKQHVLRNHICQIFYKFVCWQQYDWSYQFWVSWETKKVVRWEGIKTKLMPIGCILHDCGVCLTEQTHEFVWSLLLIIKKRPLNNSANYKNVAVLLVSLSSAQVMWVAMDITKCDW